MPIFNEGDLDRLRELYPERPGKLSHKLLGHPLLTLEALVELGKRLPRAQVEYNAGDLLWRRSEAVAHNGFVERRSCHRGLRSCMVLNHVDD